MQASQFDERAFRVADAQFHRAIASAAHNPVLEHLAACLDEGILACIAATTPQPFNGSFSLGLHEAIFEAISCGSVLDARRAMTAHMTLARQELQRREKDEPHIHPTT
jgi:DNA-binding FadR family transcriptional regulator